MPIRTIRRRKSVTKKSKHFPTTSKSLKSKLKGGAIAAETADAAAGTANTINTTNALPPKLATVTVAPNANADPKKEKQVNTTNTTNEMAKPATVTVAPNANADPKKEKQVNTTNTTNEIAPKPVTVTDANAVTVPVTVPDANAVPALAPVPASVPVPVADANAAPNPTPASVTAPDANAVPEGTIASPEGTIAAPVPVADANAVPEGTIAAPEGTIAAPNPAPDSTATDSNNCPNLSVDVPKCMTKTTFNELAKKVHPDKNVECSPENLNLLKEKMQLLTTNKDAQTEKYGDLSEEAFKKCNADSETADSETADSETADSDGEPDCTVCPSLFGSADPKCYVEQNMPEFQVALQEAFTEKISSMGTRALMDFLIATGNKALVQAIMAKSMTPQQALLLKKVIKDPQVAEAVGEVKDTLLEGVNQSIENVKESVLPKLEEAAGDVATGVGGSVITAASDIPPVGAVISLMTGIGTIVDAAENATQIKDKFETAIKPLENATEEIGRVNNVVNDAVARAESEIPQAPALPGIPGVEVGTEAGTKVGVEAGTKVGVEAGTKVGVEAGTKVGTEAGTEAGTGEAGTEAGTGEAGTEAGANSQIQMPSVKSPTATGAPPRRSDYPAGDDGSAAYDAAQNKFVANKRSQIGVQPGVQPQSIKMKTGVDAPTPQPIERQPTAAAVIGGSRKRRRIAKLSRRIERTLRRVQKKYGLQDKNSFLRRTLHSRKK